MRPRSSENASIPQGLPDSSWSPLTGYNTTQSTIGFQTPPPPQRTTSSFLFSNQSLALSVSPLTTGAPTLRTHHPFSQHPSIPEELEDIMPTPQLAGRVVPRTDHFEIETSPDDPSFITPFRATNGGTTCPAGPANHLSPSYLARFSTPRGSLATPTSSWRHIFRSSRTASLSTPLQRERIKVDLAAFPPEVRACLSKFDRDGDGSLDAGALEEAAVALAEARRTAASLKRLLCLFVVLLIVSCGALGGILYLVIQSTQQMHVLREGILAVKGTTTPLRVLSTNDLLPGALSPSLPPSTLAALRYVKIYSATGAVLNLRVGGTMVQPGAGNATSSLQVFLDPVGSLEVDAESNVFFEESLTGVFQRAGLDSQPAPDPPGATGRRLLSASSSNLTALYNTLPPFA